MIVKTMLGFIFTRIFTHKVVFPLMTPPSIIQWGMITTCKGHAQIALDVAVHCELLHIVHKSMLCMTQFYYALAFYLLYQATYLS